VRARRHRRSPWQDLPATLGTEEEFQTLLAALGDDTLQQIAFGAWRVTPNQEIATLLGRSLSSWTASSSGSAKSGARGDDGSDPLQTRPFESIGTSARTAFATTSKTLAERPGAKIEDYLRDLVDRSGRNCWAICSTWRSNFAARREKPTVEEYVRRFPQDVALVRSAFVDTGCLAPEWD